MMMMKKKKSNNHSKIVCHLHTKSASASVAGPWRTCDHPWKCWLFWSVENWATICWGTMVAVGWKALHRAFQETLHKLTFQTYGMFHQPFAQPCWQLRSNVSSYYLEDEMTMPNSLDSFTRFPPLERFMKDFCFCTEWWDDRLRGVKSRSPVSNTGTGQNECLASCPSMAYMMRFYKILPTTCNIFQNQLTLNQRI